MIHHACSGMLYTAAAFLRGGRMRRRRCMRGSCASLLPLRLDAAAAAARAASTHISASLLRLLQRVFAAVCSNCGVSAGFGWEGLGRREVAKHACMHAFALLRLFCCGVFLRSVLETEVEEALVQWCYIEYIEWVSDFADLLLILVALLVAAGCKFLGGHYSTVVDCSIQSISMILVLLV